MTPLRAAARSGQLAALVLFITSCGSDDPELYDPAWADDSGSFTTQEPSTAGSGAADGGARAENTTTSGQGSEAGAGPVGAGDASAGEVGMDCTQMREESINDDALGTDLRQFNFEGDWQRSMGPGKYENDEHYSAESNATATVRFTGVRASLHAARAPHHGIVEVSVDSGPATAVDLYSTDRQEDAEVWTSAVLSSGEHVLRLRVTGRKNRASTGVTVAIDRVVARSPACVGQSSVDGGSTRDAGRPDVGQPDAGGPNGETRETMYVQGRYLYTRCGERIVLRGVNHPTLYVDRAGDALAEIAKTNANAVRLFWYANNGIAIDDADAAISRAIQNHMVPILEMHDATGPANWSKMASIVSYWTSSKAVALIKKYQANLIVNIANEAGPDGGRDYAGYESVYKNAISSLRSAGIKVPIMIDASGWGRDVEVLFQKGPALIAHDPERNVLLSGHLYDVLSRAQLASLYQRAVDQNLPFLVGEFAHREPAGTCGAALDYRALIAEAQTRDIGWLAWSWGDNNAGTWWNGDCAEFDMTTTFSFDSLERWGKEVCVTDPNSLQKTSIRPASFMTGACR